MACAVPSRAWLRRARHLAMRRRSDAERRFGAYGTRPAGAERRSAFRPSRPSHPGDGRGVLNAQLAERRPSSERSPRADRRRGRSRHPRHPSSGTPLGSRATPCAVPRRGQPKSARQPASVAPPEWRATTRTVPRRKRPTSVRHTTRGEPLGCRATPRVVPPPETAEVRSAPSPRAAALVLSDSSPLNTARACSGPGPRGRISDAERRHAPYPRRGQPRHAQHRSAGRRLCAEDGASSHTGDGRRGGAWMPSNRCAPTHAGDGLGTLGSRPAWHRLGAERRRAPSHAGTAEERTAPGLRSSAQVASDAARRPTP